MKKDIDVNDCEFPPTPKKKKKIETSTELSKWQIQAPSVHAEQPASIHFLMKEENEKKKKRDFVDPYKEILSIKCI